MIPPKKLINSAKKRPNRCALYYFMESADILKAATNFADHKRRAIWLIVRFCWLILLQVQQMKGIINGKNCEQKQKFNHVAILQTNKTSTDKIRLVDAAN